MFYSLLKLAAESPGAVLTSTATPSNGMSSFWMPKASSTIASSVDNLFYFIMILCVFFFILIVTSMVYFVIKYRQKGEIHHKTADIKGNHKLEIIWSVIPGVLLVLIFAWGFKDWVKEVVPPANFYEVRVTGQKWSWVFSYPKEGFTSTELVVPVGTPIKLTMSSRDVLHSFFVPDFRIKRDVIPNRYTIVWFEAPEPGEHDVFCTEYCGGTAASGHDTMITKVKVLSTADFQTWLANGGDSGGAPTAEMGKKIFSQRGCTACHSVDGSPGTGPTLYKVYGHEQELTDGRKVTVDDAYIRKSIEYPSADVAKGFMPVMPSFRGQLSDKQIEALIEYIKSLK